MMHSLCCGGASESHAQSLVCFFFYKMTNQSERVQLLVVDLALSDGEVSRQCDALFAAAGEMIREASQRKLAVDKLRDVQRCRWSSQAILTHQHYKETHQLEREVVDKRHGHYFARGEGCIGRPTRSTHVNG